MDSPRIETALFVHSKLMVHRKIMMFEFATSGCLLAANSGFKEWDLF